MTALQRSVIEQTCEPELFLNVRRSVSGLAWYDRLSRDQANIAQAISQRYDLPELLGRVMAGRGASIDDVPLLLDPKIKAFLPDPETVQDMACGAERIAEAIVRKEQVAVFGDYDVDGAASSALIKKFFRAHGCDARIYIPDRIGEGYGPNVKALDLLIGEGAGLIITVDCGTASHEALGAVAGKRADIVVIDHHQADAELPPAAAIINPNRQDDLSGMGHLAAAGVVFLVLIAVTRCLRMKGFYKAGHKEPDLLQWLDIVGLATVCDVVPLQGLNRAYVHQGLKVMRMRRNLGLRALADAAGLSAPPTPYHLGFVLGPRINAGGRIGESGLGAKLLTTGDELEAERIAGLLDRLNKERKAMEMEILEEASARADAYLEEGPNRAIVITGSKDWHRGLVGLVASRVVEKFKRPAIVISWDDGETGTGSGRSITGVDLGAAVRAAMDAGLLIKGGGHAMAAGLTVHKDKVDALAAFLNERLRDDVSVARDKAGLKIDGALMPRSVSLDMVNLLEKAGPYGASNPAPRFAFPAHQVSYAKVVGEAHIRCTLMASDQSRINAIAFRTVGTALGDFLLQTSGRAIHIAGKLRRDSWGGREKIELVIDDAADPAKQ